MTLNNILIGKEKLNLMKWFSQKTHQDKGLHAGGLFEAIPQKQSRGLGRMKSGRRESRVKVHY